MSSFDGLQSYIASFYFQKRKLRLLKLYFPPLVSVFIQIIMNQDNRILNVVKQWFRNNKLPLTPIMEDFAGRV